MTFLQPISEKMRLEMVIGMDMRIRYHPSCCIPITIVSLVFGGPGFMSCLARDICVARDK